MPNLLKLGQLITRLDESGSRQSELWDINLHPESLGDNDYVKFDSLKTFDLIKTIVCARLAILDSRATEPSLCTARHGAL